MRAAVASVLLSVLVGLSNTQTIDPDSVDINIRNTWCVNQMTSCPLLCLQYPGQSAETAANECDAETLVYSCVCENGLSPNASEYSQTIPFYICQEAGNQCVSACGQDASCATNCRTAHPCGAQNPTRVNTSTITTMAATATGTSGSSSEATSTPNYNGLGGAAATQSASGKGAASQALNLGQSYGLAVVISGLFAGFALML